MGAVVVVGQLRLPAAHAVDERHAEPIVGRPQIAVVLRVETHERRPLDLHLEALRMHHRIGAVPQDRRAASEGRIPERPLLTPGDEDVWIRSLVHHAADPRLLGPRQVARVDEVVGEHLPEPWPRRPEVGELLGKRPVGHEAVVGARRHLLVGHVEHDRALWARWRQGLHAGLGQRIAGYDRGLRGKGMRRGEGVRHRQFGGRCIRLADRGRRAGEHAGEEHDAENRSLHDTPTRLFRHAAPHGKTPSRREKSVVARPRDYCENPTGTVGNVPPIDTLKSSSAVDSPPDRRRPTLPRRGLRKVGQSRISAPLSNPPRRTKPPT